MTEEAKYQLIEKHFAGELSPEEQTVFEDLLQQDADFKDQVEFHETIELSAKAAAHQSLRDEMVQGITSFDAKKKRSPWTKGLFVFVAVLLGIGATVLLTQENTNNTTVSKTKKLDTTLPATSKNVEVLEQAEPKDKETLQPNIENKNDEVTVTVDSLVITTIPHVTDSTIADSTLRISQVESLPSVRTQETDVAAKPIEENPCTSFNPIIELESIATCDGKDEGIIQIGEMPTDVWLIFQGEEYRAFEEIQFLSAGNYEVTAKNAADCQKAFELTIVTKTCKKTKFGINPNFGDTWQPEFDSDGTVDIKIISKSRNIVYTYSGDASDFTPWNGKDEYGVGLPAGLYAYIITYANGIVENGQITIVY